MPAAPTPEDEDPTYRPNEEPKYWLVTKERRIKAEVDRAAYIAKSKEGKAPKTMATWPLQESPDQPVQKGKHICIHTSRSLLICFVL